MPRTVLGVDLERMPTSHSSVQLFTRLSDSTFSYRHFKMPAANTELVETELHASLKDDDIQLFYELRSAVVTKYVERPTTIFFVAEHNPITGDDVIGTKMRMADTIKGADFIAAFQAATSFEKFRLLGYC